jgi:hypothetical protein
VNHKEVTEAQPLLSGTSAQKAELIILIRPVTLGKGKRLNVYTDSNMPSSITCSCSYIEGKRIPLQAGIPSKTRNGNSPIIRGYPPTKGSDSDPLPVISTI